MHRNALIVVISLFTLLLVGACGNNSSSGGAAHTIDEFSLSLLKGEWFYSASYGWGRVTIDASGTVTQMTSSHCVTGNPVTAHITFSITTDGAVVGHGTFECTKQPGWSMIADSVVYTLQMRSDGQRMDGTVAITSTSGNINQTIIFERR